LQIDALLSLKDSATAFQGSGGWVSAQQAAAIPDALAVCDWHLRPAGERALAVQLDRLAAWAKSFNVPHDPRAMPAAFASLASIPPDLIGKAFDAAMATTRDTFRLPLPAAIRAHVADDIATRHRVKSGLLKMQMFGTVEPRKRKRTPEELATADAAMAELRAANEARKEALSGKPANKRRTAVRHDGPLHPMQGTAATTQGGPENSHSVDDSQEDAA